MSTTGNFIDADQAVAWGLVNHVVTDDELLPFCRGLALDIVSNDQAGVRQMLDTYHRIGLTTGDEGWDIEAEISRDPGPHPARPGRGRGPSPGHRRARPRPGLTRATSSFLHRAPLQGTERRNDGSGVRSR